MPKGRSCNWQPSRSLEIFGGRPGYPAYSPLIPYQPNPASLEVVGAGMKSTAPSAERAATSVAKPLAPEDLRVGDYVALLRTLYEVPTFFWCGEPSLEDRSELIVLRMLPDQPTLPLQIEAVCLPFVLVSSPSGEPRSLDIRRHQLARLDARFARQARRLQKARRKKHRKRAKGRK